MEKNANGFCPSNAATGKHWERKNSFGVMGRDETMKASCIGPDKDPRSFPGSRKYWLITLWFHPPQLFIQMPKIQYGDLKYFPDF